jgi:TrkA-N domain
VFGVGPLDFVYYDLQLFLVSSAPVSYGGPYPWQLEIARFGAPASFAYAVLATARLLLDRQLHHVRSRRARDHAIVCGGGEAGMVLGRGLRRSGRPVVIVDVDTPPSAARAAGLLHVAGDPRSAEVLDQAGARRAAEVFVLERDSADSLATVLAVARLSGPRVSPACYAIIGDREVYSGLQARQLAMTAGTRLRLELVHLPELVAQACLDIEPPPAPGTRAAHVAVVGLGELGQSLVVELARRWRERSAPPLLVTAMDPDAVAVVATLERQARFLARSCRVRARPVRGREPAEEELSALLEEEAPPDRVYVCGEDDVVSLRIGLRVLRARLGHAARVVVFVERSTAFSTAFDGDERLFDDARGSLRVLAIPMHLVLTPERIRDSLTDRLARAFHASYLEACFARGERLGDRPALVPWEDLPDRFRDSNRHQATDVGHKLDAIDCALVPGSGESGVFAYAGEAEVERLARVEHDRWLRERRGGAGAGGAGAVNGHAHPDLVSWEQLSWVAREKDAQVVRDMPGILADAGFQIVRRR